MFEHCLCSLLAESFNSRFIITLTLQKATKIAYLLLECSQLERILKGFSYLTKYKTMENIFIFLKARIEQFLKDLCRYLFKD